MGFIPIILGFCVGVINMIMNKLVKSTVENHKNNNYLDTLFSIDFLYAFLVGIISITTVFTFYYFSDRFNFAQAMIFMGATSIVSGTIYGVIVLKDTLSDIDILILVVLILLSSYKLYISQ